MLRAGQCTAGAVPVSPACCNLALCSAVLMIDDAYAVGLMHPRHPFSSCTTCPPSNHPLLRLIDEAFNACLDPSRAESNWEREEVGCLCDVSVPAAIGHSVGRCFNP